MDAQGSIYPQRVRKKSVGQYGFGLPSIDDRVSNTEHRLSIIVSKAVVDDNRVSMHRPGRRQTWHDGRGHVGAGNSVGAATEARSGSRWISVDFWRDVGFCARMASARMGRDKL